MVMIKKIAVLGAGVMGSQIAGHLANCGFEVLMCDIEKSIAEEALGRLKKTKPPALFSEVVLKKIKTGNINDDLQEALGYDWVIEVVPEQLRIKRELYEKIERFLKPGKIITSNTSGISLSLLTEARSAGFKKAFMITHFFNPVRYMKLVELICGPETDKEYREIIKNFLSEKMGKGVVEAKDTPGFIANRIGVFAAMNGINKTIKNGWKIEVVDAVMGEPAAFPRSAVFRTADLVGIDTLLHVADNTLKLCPDDNLISAISPDEKVRRLVDGGKTGVKSGAGFYKKEGEQILVLDFNTFEYHTREKVRADSIGKVRKITDPAERLMTLFAEDDEVAEIAKELITDLLGYARSVAAEISDSEEDVNNAMKWGYNWELGPYEMVDAIKTGKIEKKVKKRGEIVKKNGSARLVDLGDGVLCCEFQSKMNSIDPDIIAMINEGLDLTESSKYSGLLITNEAPDFSVGANLFMIAMAIGSKDYKQIENLVKAFQDVNQRIRFSQKPVLVAPFGRTLGGGCEVTMAANHHLPAAETYMGLVELGVGLIPAGGGCKNLLLNMEERLFDKHNTKDEIWFSAKDGGPFPKVAKTFEIIATAKVAVSALDAGLIGYLPRNTTFILDREKLTERAKGYLLQISGSYSPAKFRDDILLPGRGGEMALTNNLKSLFSAGKISEFEVTLAGRLAHVLCGGNVPTGHLATEQDILDLEREVFLELCGMEKTVERIQHMLTTGKPLRN